METPKRLLLLWMMLCLSLTLQAQIESHLTYRRYTTQDGLPQMQTERLWQDSRGYIYMGTLSGFVRYDGKTFTPFLKGRRLNIVGFAEVGDEVRALGFFRQWSVGYDDVVSFPLDPKGHWLLNNLNAGSLPNGYVLMEDSLEEHRRLCRMTPRGVETVLVSSLLDEMTPDRKLYVDSLRVMIPTESGLYQVRRGSRRAVRMSTRQDIYTLLYIDSTLLAFAPDGVYSVRQGGWQRVAHADWTAVNYGLTVRLLRNGHIVIADEHSLYLFDGRDIRQLFTGINLIRDIMVDRWDRLWVASYQGVYCFFNRQFTNHQLTDGNDIVRTVSTDGAGRLVMGTLNGKVLTSPNPSEGGEQGASPSGRLGGVIIIDDNPEQFYAPSATRIGGSIYMAGNGDIVRLSDSRLQWLGLPRDRYQFVSEAWGQLITANRNSIFCYNPQTGVTDTLTSSILHPWCATHDKKGRLWIGSSSGLFSITQDKRLTKWVYPMQKLIVSTIDADIHGNIFFASADSVFIVHNNEVVPLNPQMPQLAGHEVRSLHVSPHGYLVVAVVDGLFVASISADGQVDDIHFYNHQNGFTMTESLKTTMAETADGTVWLPGVEQMTSFRPADLMAYHEEDTYITPPLRWWQHWWVWLCGLLLLSLSVWAATRWYEQRRNRQRMIRLQHEKMQKERQIEAIRQKAIEDASTQLAQDIVKMTRKTGDGRLTFRTASGSIMVETQDIVYFKGDGNYSQIVTFYDKDTVLVGLGALEKMLSPDVFVRADRSTLVNIHYISSLLPKQRRCIFRSPTGQEVETTLLAPAFKRLQQWL